MKTNKVMLAVASLLLAAGTVMAQTSGPQSSAGNRLDPMVTNQDPNALPNTRAEVKSERATGLDPKTMKNTEVPPTKNPSVSSNSRGEVKAQAKRTASKADTEDLSRATDPMSNSKPTSTRTQRKADAKAKRDSKMSGSQQPTTSAQ